MFLEIMSENYITSIRSCFKNLPSPQEDYPPFIYFRNPLEIALARRYMKLAFGINCRRKYPEMPLPNACALFSALVQSAGLRVCMSLPLFSVASACWGYKPTSWEGESAKTQKMLPCRGLRPKPRIFSTLRWPMQRNACSAVDVQSLAMQENAGA